MSTFNPIIDISIVTPSYNQGQYLVTTINSIVTQRTLTTELIVIDGGSNDNSIKVIEKYKKDIAYWVSEPDNGQSHAINKGLKKAKGKYAMWINSDDLLAKGGAINMLKAIEQYPETDLFAGQHLELNIDGELKDKGLYYLNNFTLPYLLTSFPYTQPACFFKMEMVKKIGFLDERFQVTMDLDLFLRIVLSGGEIKRINKPIGIFRKQPNAKTATFSKLWEEERNFIFNKYLRSIDVPQIILDKIKQTGVYQQGIEKYEVAISISEDTITESIKIFLIDTVHLYFWNHRYKDAFYFILELQKYFPEWVDNEIKKLKIKSWLSISPISRGLLNISLKIYRWLKNCKLGLQYCANRFPKFGLI